MVDLVRTSSRTPLLLLPVIFHLGAHADVPPSTGGDAPSLAQVEGSRARTHYLLACGGCHGVEGTSNSILVPDLKGQVGYFLQTPQGRGYLIRVPNVAFCNLSDRELAEMMNFVVRDIGGASAPRHFKSYGAAEVKQLRLQPLTEVSLLEYRARMVKTLIAAHRAPARLAAYGTDRYHDPR